MGTLEKKYSPPERIEEMNADIIILLGGGVITDVQDVDGAGTLCASPANRLLTAVRLQKLLNLPILLSGGQGNGNTEAESIVSGRILKSLGVPEEKILLESNSLNTTQNAVYSAEIMREKNFKRPLLVTSAFHMRRSVLNFAKCGVEVTAYPADYRLNTRHDFHYNKLKPSVDALLDNVVVMQEVLRAFITRYLE